MCIVFFFFILVCIINVNMLSVSDAEAGLLGCSAKPLVSSVRALRAPGGEQHGAAVLALQR